MPCVEASQHSSIILRRKKRDAWSSWTFSSQAHYIFLWEVVFPFKLTPDASVHDSVHKKVGEFFISTEWMVASWNWPKQDFALLVWTANEASACWKTLKNIDPLCFAKFQMPTGHFDSHLCLWQDFNRLNLASQKRPLLFRGVCTFLMPFFFPLDLRVWPPTPGDVVWVQSMPSFFRIMICFCTTLRLCQKNDMTYVALRGAGGGGGGGCYVPVFPK